MTTIFEKIISNEIKSYKIYEDNLFIIILDLNQTHQGHSLIIPKKMKKNILLEDDKTIEEGFKLAKKYSKILMNKLEANSIKWVVNTGEYAGQVIEHTHIHLIPYYKHKNNENNSIEKVYNKIIN